MSNPSCSNEDNIGALIFNRSCTAAAREMAATSSTVQPSLKPSTAVAHSPTVQRTATTRSALNNTAINKTNTAARSTNTGKLRPTSKPAHTATAPTVQRATPSSTRPRTSNNKTANRTNTCGPLPPIKSRHSWMEMFESLKSFQKKNHHCKVPQEYAQVPTLGVWVSMQRFYYKSMIDGKKQTYMTNTKLNLLSSIGFEWTGRRDAWVTMFQSLQSYKARHGDCNVPRYSKDYTKLATWVYLQRAQYGFLQRGKPSFMTHERITQLESVGFTWTRHIDQWQGMYDRLKAYKNHNGDCNIPYRYPEDQTLAQWVFTQRKMKNRVIKKNGKYWKRVEKLNEIGFVWSIR